MKEPDKDVAPTKDPTKEQILQKILANRTLVPEDSPSSGPMGYKTQNPKPQKPL